MPSFSVVIPTYDRPDLTRRAIQSCIAQTKQPLEIIVVDDHSPHPFEWNGDPIVRVARHERNFGGGRARNTGIDLARGDFVCFLDSDDLWLPEKLSAVERAVAESPASKDTVFFHDLITRQTGREDRLLPNPDLDGAPRILDYIFLKSGIVQTSTLVVPAEAAKRVRFDDALRIHQDWDFSHRLDLAGLKFQRIPIALAIWSEGEGQKRVSINRNAGPSMAWVSKLGDTVSRDTMIAINYKVIVPRIRRTNPTQALIFMWRAQRSGAMGTAQFVKDTALLPLAALRGQARRVRSAK